jgi:hypothetical protein
MVGCEICREFVKVGFRNRPGDAQDFLPHWERLFCVEIAAFLAAALWGAGAH